MGTVVGPTAKPRPLLAQETLHAACRVEAEGRAAGEHDGVSHANGAFESDGVPVARARAAAEDRRRGHRGGVA